ncbi:PREDICTED: chitin-binding lectin 1-like [Camelina sativa]|uniref:Chitin-binding lectin 1-like n=1 Tax=Camelina sativa TaxID=90675 RepID=A0ABM0YC59_CAMSA|nr:PREDICTED: chitin-binding lectin 1-like [Camelina sativa]
MPENSHRRGSVVIFTVMLITLLTCPTLINASSSDASLEARKLDEVDPIKCSPSCIQNPPPPSPPPPSPPPPACPPPPALPPPPPKKVSPNCPPPPPANFLYITGPPGNLYPVDEQFGATAGKSFTVVLSGLIALGIMGFLIL